MQLSRRLRAVADLLGKGLGCVADVGCDHGYVSICLVLEGMCEHVIAMDVREGPLGRAKEHIRQHGLEQQIETRCSDGVDKLASGEADGMIVAGMGGALTIHILEQGTDVISKMTRCVLQPQSEIAKVRRYLWEHGFTIEAEDLVLEDGKFYPMMRVTPGKAQSIPEELYELYAQYGQFLLMVKHPVLRQLVEKEYEINTRLMARLQEVGTARERLGQLACERKLMEQALSMLDGTW